MAAMLLSVTAFSQSSTLKDSLYKNFLNPPAAAKPRVWWHWMNGNITKDGIRKDLEWMHRSGIGGFQNFDASLMTPQIVDKRLTYMTPEWIDAFKFTTKLADSLQLEMAIAGSPGWSETGGPWVKPEDGMKKIVWTELRVKAGVSNIQLARPSDATGPFQNIVKLPGFGEAVDESKLSHFYKDVAVIAYKVSAADKSLNDLGAVITSSGGNFNLDQLTDGDLNTTNLLPRDSIKGTAWIQFAFPQPVTIKAITMVGGGNPGVFGQGADPVDGRILEVSDDGLHFKFVTNIFPGAIVEQTMSIPATTARYFRIKVKNPPVQFNGLAAMVGMDVKPFTPPGTAIAEIRLHPMDVINRFEEKAAFAPVGDLNKKITAATIDVVNENDIIELTDKMNEDGKLAWSAPAGEWKIFRFGYSLLGIDNHPASPEATGPEVDKLDPVAIKNYFENYLNQYKNATGGLMGAKGGLQFMVTDSWEAGAQNWTGNMMQEFEKRRGYSMKLWMPVLTGAIIKSSEASEQFLFDFRKTLSEMVAEYHYDGLTKILAEWGMKRYSESHEDGRAMIADGMEVKRTAAVPMSALWTPNPFINQNDQTKYTADIRESASVAHIYGQNLVAAESLTALGVPSGAWSYAPENLKSSVDLELANGLNRFVIHCSPHQPVDDKIPGLGLGPFGQWFTRHETWAPQANVWTDYLARSSYMLQQGKFVADILYHYGEDNNITYLFGKGLPPVPEGYNFDFINTDALMNVLSVKDGKLVTPAGMVYRVLVLDSSAIKMSVATLRKLKALIVAGAVVAGIKPIATPALADDLNEFKQLVGEIWSPSNVNVSEGKPLAEVLNTMKILPDFSYTKPQNNTKLVYVHRKAGDRDIYWINSRTNNVENLELTFRVTGKVPELWFPDNGKTEPLSYSIADGITRVKLHLEPQDAVFVVFKEKAIKTAVELPAVKLSELATINGSWNVSFQKGRGAPATAVFNELSSYTTNADPGIKYFSGVATYTKNINASAAWFLKDAELWLNLGDVKNIAEVKVNGKLMGTLWKAPFRINISGALKAGNNKIEIKVTNLWVNRLIGDAQPGVTNKITYTTMPFYRANSPLLPSGLLGPVKVASVNRK